MRCSRCGALVDEGQWVLAVDTDVELVAQLLRGGLDVIRCPARHPTTLPSRLFFWASAERMGVLTDTLCDLPDWPGIAEGLVERFGWNGVGRNADSVERFKFLVAAMLRERIRPVLAQLTVPEADEGDDWRALTGGVFTALAIALTGALPSVVFADDAAEALAIVQVTVWLRLCREWSRRPLHGSFEDDLDTFIDRTVPIGRALAMFTEELDTLAEDAEADNLLWSYRARAVEASLYHHAGLQNPSGREWARSYLWFELRTDDTRRRGSLAVRTRIGEHRARATVDAVDLGPCIELAIVVFTGPPSGSRISDRRWANFTSRIERSCRHAGHTNLADRIFANFTLTASGPDSGPADTLIALIETSPPEQLTSIGKHQELWARLGYEGDPADFAHLAALLTARIGGYNTIMTMALALLQGRHPTVLLDLVDAVPVSGDLGVFHRTELSDLKVQGWCLGGHADRGLAEVRRHDQWMSDLRAEHLAGVDGLEVWIHDLEFHPLGHKHKMVAASALFEAGHVDQAIPLMEELWAGLRPSLLPHVAVMLAPAYFAVGRFGDAVQLLQQGLAHTVAFSAGVTPILRAQLQYGRLRDGRDARDDLWDVAMGVVDPDALVEAITDGRAPESSVRRAAMSPLAGLYLAMAQLEQLRRQPGVAPDHADWLGGLSELSAAAGARGDCHVDLQAERARVMHLELDGADTWSTWRDVRAKASTVYEVDPPLESLVFPVVQVVQLGDLPQAYALIRHADDIIGRAVAKLDDFEQAAGVELVRRDDVALISRRLFTIGAPLPLLRVLHELWRDPVRRMLGPSPLADDETLRRFSERHRLGRTAVVECVSTGEDENVVLVTVLEAGSTPRTEVLLTFEGLRPLATRLNTRLERWLPHRPGDPLDEPRWLEIAERLRQRLHGRLTDTDHVVMIEPTQYRLPWHQAIAPHWTFSYCASWGSLLARPEEPAAFATMGAVCVPTYGESALVRTALTESLRRCEDDARRAGMAFTSAVFEGADAAGVDRVLQEADICSVMCHGLVEQGRSSVTLLLAANGSAPTGDSVAAASPAGRAHLYDWRAATKVEKAPRMILSAACSSGVHHLRGGQQCGLYSALRHRGLRTLVAPRWNVLAAPVLPILDRCRELVLSGTGPAAALRLASIEAEQAGLPVWLAWSLTLEGDW
ncbi:CHAT domain-containing protein [Catellatospora citrea]|uniref:CHAT domain-containing protein n=1 Tax=Catellatospora citrea TaxID=53366 RepID=UPI003401F6A3